MVFVDQASNAVREKCWDWYRRCIAVHRSERSLLRRTALNGSIHMLPERSAVARVLLGLVPQRCVAQELQIEALFFLTNAPGLSGRAHRAVEVVRRIPVLPGEALDHTDQLAACSDCTNVYKAAVPVSNIASQPAMPKIMRAGVFVEAPASP
jgi:hypothetical protein